MAMRGAGHVAPNPMVGAVLVYNERIIGEGYHEQFGNAHAEVNCINSVKKDDRHLIEKSVLYVSLEPCAHFGKTPPCADLIIKNKIPEVIIGCRDPFSAVNGKGIEKLTEAGVRVLTGILEEACRDINKRFFCFHENNRPYIILKWSQTFNGKTAGSTPERLLISNSQSNRLVHKWRSEEMSILIGTKTALYDNPVLSTRLWPGKNPIRLVIDKDLKLPGKLKIFDGSIPTIIFNLHKHNIPSGLKASELSATSYYQVTNDVSLVHQLVNALYTLNIQSLIVEGGTFLQQSFIDENMWDEARVITNNSLRIEEGLPAPVLTGGKCTAEEKLVSDTIRYYYNKLQ